MQEELEPEPLGPQLLAQNQPLQEVLLQKVTKNSQRSLCSLGAENRSLQQELRSSWVSSYLPAVPTLQMLARRNPQQNFIQQLLGNIRSLQGSQQALQAENQGLQKEVQALQAENEKLKQELESCQRAQVPEETAQEMPSPGTTGRNQSTWKGLIMGKSRSCCKGMKATRVFPPQSP